MKCERCGKQDAVVRITRIEPDGHKTTVNLGQCDECMVEIKYPMGLKGQQQSGDEVLKEILQQAVGKSKGELTEVPFPDLQCPSCGLDFVAYRSTGMLGCPDCYTAFEEVLEPDLKRYHRASRHITSEEDGRREELASIAERLATIRTELREAVENEDFAHAAWLRDEAAQMEARLAGGEAQSVAPGKE